MATSGQSNQDAFILIEMDLGDQRVLGLSSWYGRELETARMEK